jgi:lipoate-protein ligase A
MQLLDLNLPTPEENLALDEALVEEADAGGVPLETLRLWEPSRPMVVVGRSSRVTDEVQLEECARRNIPVLRRASGGAAIVTGSGCLMYAVVLSYQRRPDLRLIDHAHRFVLDQIVSAIEPRVPGVVRCGTSDLALGELKFSGNSVRCKRDHILYHGTLLYDFPLELIETCLRMPPRQPDYRRNRAHGAFVTNLPLGVDELRQALIATWNAREIRTDWPRDLTARLVAERYTQPTWNAAVSP